MVAMSKHDTRRRAGFTAIWAIALIFVLAPQAAFALYPQPYATVGPDPRYPGATVVVTPQFTTPLYNATFAERAGKLLNAMTAASNKCDLIAYEHDVRLWNQLADEAAAIQETKSAAMKDLKAKKGEDDPATQDAAKAASHAFQDEINLSTYSLPPFNYKECNMPEPKPKTKPKKGLKEYLAPDSGTGASQPPANPTPPPSGGSGNQPGNPPAAGAQSNQPSPSPSTSPEGPEKPPVDEVMMKPPGAIPQPDIGLASWTGPYVGAQIVGSFSRVNTREFYHFTGMETDSFNIDGSGFGGGINGGYNWRFGSSPFVGGVVIEVNFPNDNATERFYDWRYSVGSTTEVAGSASALLGYNPTPNWLLYGTAGLTVANQEQHFNLGGPPSSDGRVTPGFTAGVGGEWMIPGGFGPAIGGSPSLFLQLDETWFGGATTRTPGSSPDYDYNSTRRTTGIEAGFREHF